MHQQKIFYCGTQYFRPPNPPRDQHRFHLEKIKNELGFNIIKLFWLWNSSQRAPGAFDFSEYEEVLEICDELELNVLVNTCLEDAPYWLERAHPECRYVNAKGQAAELSGNDNHPSGGHPGLCFDNPVVMKEAEKFLAALVSCVTAHPSFLGYDCWIEPHIEPNWNTSYWADQGRPALLLLPGIAREVPPLAAGQVRDGRGVERRLGTLLWGLGGGQSAEALLCIFNDSRFETHTELITIPPRYTQAVDIHTDDPVAVRNAKVEVTVAREDVKVLYLCQG